MNLKSLAQNMILDPFGSFLDPFGPILGTLEYTLGNFDSKSFDQSQKQTSGMNLKSLVQKTDFWNLFGPFLDPFRPFWAP